MKYFVLGALASGLLLYGMSMIYGAAGTLEISSVADMLFSNRADKLILGFGVVFLVAGIAFKLGVDSVRLVKKIDYRVLGHAAIITSLYPSLAR